MTEVSTHLGLYAGWGKATEAITAVARTLGQQRFTPALPVTAIPPLDHV